MNLETVTGQLVNPENPDPATISLTDIAWGLSRISRFCGHTITVQPYTVGQHSLFVAKEVETLLKNNTYPDVTVSQNWWEEVCWGDDPTIKNQLVLYALLHDAAEVYMGDLPSPIKHIPELREVIKKIETRLQNAIYEAFNLPVPSDDIHAIVKWADRVAQKIEAHAFMPSRGKNWPGLPDVSLEKLQSFAQPMPSIDTYKAFVEMFSDYYKLLEKNK